MHYLRKRRLMYLIALMLTTAIIAALVLYALKQNINLYFTPSQVAAHQVKVGQNFRMGGFVKKGSIVFLANGVTVEFILTDRHHDILVQYQGILPDLFHDDQGVVVEGYLNQNHKLIATQVLAKHDEKYMPPEIRQLLPNKNQ